MLIPVAMRSADGVVLAPISLEDVDEIALLEATIQGWSWTREQVLYEIAPQSRSPQSRSPQGRSAQGHSLGGEGGAFSQLAKVPGRGVGIAGYYFARQVLDCCELLNILVIPALRRTGIGSMLLEHFCEQAKLRGARLLQLELRASNEAARALYERVGFRVVGSRKAYYRDNGEDAVLMSAQITVN